MWQPLGHVASATELVDSSAMRFSGWRRASSKRAILRSVPAIAKTPPAYWSSPTAGADTPPPPPPRPRPFPPAPAPPPPPRHPPDEDRARAGAAKAARTIGIALHDSYL